MSATAPASAIEHEGLVGHNVVKSTPATSYPWGKTMSRRVVTAILGGIAGALLLLSTASACVGGPILQVAPTDAKAGAEVTLTGISFDKSLPLVVRFNALDGPILGTFPINDDRSLSATKVRIPPGTRPGSYVLVGTQLSSTGSQAVVPTRALVVVVGDGGAPVLGAPVLGEQTGRPAGLVEEKSSASLGSLALVGLGVFGVALLVAGALAFFSTDRGGETTPAKVRT